MKLSEMFDDSRVLVNFKATDKKEVLGKLLDMVVNGYQRDELLKELYDREELGSTGIGYGVAVPHVRLDDISEPVVAFGKSAQPIDFDALDDEPCTLFFLILGPTGEESQSIYLKVMAKISRLMRNKAVRDALNAATSADDVRRIIAENEA